MSDWSSLPASREDGSGAGYGDRQRAERFYVQCGWEKAGEIPRYALMPDGR
jgi:hypothetical protein